MKNVIQTITVRIGNGFRPITGKHLNLIGSFIVGQGAVQTVQLLTGFFLIRWLTVEQYAQYSIAFAFQSTAQILVELGFAGSIIALVGRRVQEKEVVGGYVKAAKFFRNRLFAVVAVVCLVAFPLITKQHNWSFFIILLLLLAIISNLYLSGNSAFYGTPLIMNGRLSDLYRTQFKSGVFRFLFISLLSFFSVLNAWIAALASSAAVWYNGRIYKRRAGELISEPSKTSGETKKEMLRYATPVIPGIVYSAFSAQIALFIIGVFGNTQNIAEVGALGRLGQMFFILNAASSVLVVPFLARQPGKNLKNKYLLILSAASLVALIMTFAAFAMPEPLLWIMGAKYAHLEKEVGLMVLNSAIVFLNVIMWDMNCSRKWLWSWIPVLSISSNVLVQIFLVIKMDLNTTYSVLIYSIILSVFNLSNKVLVAVIGIKKTENETDILYQNS